MRALFLALAAPAAMLLAPAGPAQAKGPVPGQAAPISAEERAQGNELNPSIVSEYGGEFEGPQAAYVERIGRKIAVQSGLASDPSAFDVTLLNSPVNNAFAIPGGYVYSTRQLLALMNDEAELAAVLGHEVGHVAARHSKKRQATATRNSILGVLGQVLVGAVAGNSALGELLGRGIGAGAQLATLGYSRGQETESDELGVAYLSSAGYDPYAMSTLLESLAAQNTLDQQIAGSSRSVPEWASTHPDPASRVARAQQLAAAAPRGGVRNRDAFLAAIDGMLYGEDPEQGVIDGRQFVHPKLGFAFTIPTGFTMQNGARAVSIEGNGAQGEFSLAAYDGSLDNYVRSVVGTIVKDSTRYGNIPVQRTTVNGIPAAYSQVRTTSGRTAVDLTVFAYAMDGKTAYHFAILTGAGKGLGGLTDMLYSFRRLAKGEAAAVKARYVRVVTVRRGDTIASLARRMAYDDYQLERFLVLNRLRSDSTLTPGDKVKIVTY